MHCMTVSLADGGMGLGTMWGGRRRGGCSAEAGFTSVEAKRVDGDIVNAYIIAADLEVEQLLVDRVEHVRAASRRSGRRAIGQPVEIHHRLGHQISHRCQSP